ncbi:hypothetical protein TREES_T100007269 [Tupaia chinensis]|uniref:Uncharacterized protein n=1 Tax=Tupaia chinensis TaxID=246437 RepID=L9L120_TUPCH|nr:hypothetical protein TREES_T100007269 [Tupaia chinensis]
MSPTVMVAIAVSTGVPLPLDKLLLTGNGIKMEEELEEDNDEEKMYSFAHWDHFLYDLRSPVVLEAEKLQMEQQPLSSSNSNS